MYVRAFARVTATLSSCTANSMRFGGRAFPRGGAHNSSRRVTLIARCNCSCSALRATLSSFRSQRTIEQCLCARGARAIVVCIYLIIARVYEISRPTATDAPPFADTKVKYGRELRMFSITYSHRSSFSSRFRISSCCRRREEICTAERA